MTIKNYLSYFDEMIRPTESLFHLVPADKIDWRPVEGAFTAGQLMAHMAIALKVYAGGITAGAWGVQSMREIFLRNRHTPSWTVDEALAALSESYAQFRQSVANLAQEEFDHGLIDTPQLGRVPRWRAAMLALEHHLNHKAELFMYLKLLGVKVHTGHLYRG